MNASNASALGFIALLLILGAGILWFRAARRVRLPANRSGFLAVWFCGLVLGVIALVEGVGWVGGVAAVLAVLGGSFFLLTVAISRQKVASDAIRVGATIPAFTAVDENGHRFEAASLAGHPVLIKFFRGHW